MFNIAHKAGRLGAAIAAGAMTLAPLAAAGAQGAPARTDGAELVRRLDIMLMVTSLRCRKTADDFQADYGHFTSNHLSELNGAAAELRSDFVGRLGSRGADRAIDRISTAMANEYGLGHPWLDCRDLREVTRGLAEVRGRPTLEEAADQLLARTPPARWAMARR